MTGKGSCEGPEQLQADAGKYDRMKKSVRIGLCMGLCTALTLTLIFYNFGTPLFRLFTSDENVVSIGMQQRLGIAQAIMEYQQILILDEPMNGLDNQGVKEMRELLMQLKEKGITILLASHNREDIEVLCDQVYEMDAGKLKVRA